MMAKSKFFKSALILVLFVISYSFNLASEKDALGLIKKSNSEVQKILNAKVKYTAQTEKDILKVVDFYTDFALISKRATEPFASKMSAEEYVKFKNVFKDLLRYSSVSKSGRYRVDGFKYSGVKKSGKGFAVKTTALYKEDQVEIIYFVEKVKGNWKIVNYEVDGINTIHNYRKQFKRLFTKRSAKVITEKLKKKTERMKMKE